MIVEPPRSRTVLEHALLREPHAWQADMLRGKHTTGRAQEEFLLALSIVRDLAVDQGTALRALAEATAVYADLIASRTDYKQNALGSAQIQVMCLVHASESFESLAESQIQLASSMAKAFEPANKLVSKYFNDLANAERVLEDKCDLEHKRVERSRAKGVIAEAKQNLLLLKQDHLHFFSARLAEVDLILTRSSATVASRLYTNLSDAMQKAGAANGLTGLEKWSLFLDSMQSKRQQTKHCSLGPADLGGDKDTDRIMSLKQFINEERKVAQDLPITRWRSSIVGHLERIASDDSVARDGESTMSTFEPVVRPGPDLTVEHESNAPAVHSASASINQVDGDTSTTRSARRRAKMRASRLDSDVLPEAEEDASESGQLDGLKQMQEMVPDIQFSGSANASRASLPIPSVTKSLAKKHMSMSAMSYVQNSSESLDLAKVPSMPATSPDKRRQSQHPPPLVPTPSFSQRDLPKFAPQSRQVEEHADGQQSPTSVQNRQASPSSKHRKRLSKFPGGLKLYRLFTRPSGRMKKERRQSIFGRKVVQSPDSGTEPLPYHRSAHADASASTTTLDGFLSFQHLRQQTSKPQTAHGDSSRRISMLPISPPRPVSATAAQPRSRLSLAVDTEDHGETQWVTKKIMKKQDASLRSFSSASIKRVSGATKQEEDTGKLGSPLVQTTIRQCNASTPSDSTGLIEAMTNRSETGVVDIVLAADSAPQQDVTDEAKEPEPDSSRVSPKPSDGEKKTPAGSVRSVDTKPLPKTTGLTPAPSPNIQAYQPGPNRF
ncbi:hypothetical protein BCR37DRAFT_388345 [Protomyces lactucae-debilis]|uniref:Uncharacterized protein n=1 Tax=Protomyces lactucae-debilis TaxID=2754530 RepID=A0A1Y2F7S3_PROLT|nr:uncharacterized protein BCR37DRAFT_388345 [Protomyces lactucae-debilis]ORY79970.1 hypothetical protein BCR37DRAFT_388345 [Protomyces lactucae-debilis]